MYIVQGEEAQPEYLVGHEQVPDVGAGEPGARRAIAIGVEWPWIGAVIGALDVEPTVPSEHRAVASHPRRRHAVEEVDAAPNALDEIFGKTNAHQVAWMLLRQGVIDDIDHLVHRVFLLADR